MDLESLINSTKNSNIIKNSANSSHNNNVKMNLFKQNVQKFQKSSTKSDVFFTASDNIKTSSSKNIKLNDCMQYKKVELAAMVDKFELPKKIKRLNKRLLCKQLIPYIEQEMSKQT